MEEKKITIQDLWNEIEDLRKFVRGVMWSAIAVAFMLGGVMGVLQFRVAQNADHLTSLTAKLEDQSSIIISRDQLEDILGVRDEKIENIAEDVEAINQKLDRLLNNT